MHRRHTWGVYSKELPKDLRHMQHWACCCARCTFLNHRFAPWSMCYVCCTNAECCPYLAVMCSHDDGLLVCSTAILPTATPRIFTLLTNTPRQAQLVAAASTQNSAVRIGLRLATAQTNDGSDTWQRTARSPVACAGEEEQEEEVVVCLPRAFQRHVLPCSTTQHE